MKHFFFLITVVAFGCSSNDQATKKDTEKISDKCFAYPSSIDSLQLRGLYDSARWYVYAWHCDEAYLSKTDSSKYITFGELPLEFYNLAFKHDTVEINFDFMDDLEPILPSMTRNNREFLTGVAFDLKSRQKIYMLSLSGFSTIVKGGNNRYENPLHPDVVSYIKTNQDKLDTCFRSLAERYRVLK